MARRRDTRKDPIPGYFIGGLFGGGGGGGNQWQNTSSVTTMSPTFYGPYMSVADSALVDANRLRQQAYTPYDVSKFGDMSNATQRQAWQQTAGLQGSWSPSFDNAKAALDSISGVNPVTAGADSFARAGAMPTALEAAQPFANAAGRSWGDVSSSYLNPYISDVVTQGNTFASKNFTDNILPKLANSYVASGGGLGSKDYGKDFNWALTNFNDSVNRSTQAALADAYNKSANIWQNDASRFAGLAGTMGSAATSGMNALTNLGTSQGQNASAGVASGLSKAGAWGSLGTADLTNNLTATSALLQSGNQQQEIENWKKNFDYQQFKEAQQWPYQTNSWAADTINKYQWPHSYTTNSNTMMQGGGGGGGGASPLGQILGGLASVGSLAIPGASGSSALGNIFGGWFGKSAGGAMSGGAINPYTGFTMPPFKRGGEVPARGYFRGGAARAVHKHEREMHPGKPLTKLARGGYLGLNAPSYPPFISNPGYFKLMGEHAFADGGKVGDDIGGILGMLAGSFFGGPIGSTFGAMGGRALGDLLPFAAGGHAPVVNTMRARNRRDLSALRRRQPTGERRALATAGYFGGV